MKGVLITGGAGKIGFNLVQKLIDTNYNVTILDLESKSSIKRLQKYKNIVKIVYGDVEDENLVRDLVKRNDIVIDYAGIMPPLANLNSTVANSINYGGTKNIVDAIKETNPECVYIYMSFISIYGATKMAKRRLTVGTESNYPDDYYSVSLVRSEEYIKSNLRKYVILRMPVVLTKNNYFLNSMRLDSKMDFITKDDLNNIVIGIMKSKKVLGKVYNISGFEENSSQVIVALYRSTGKIRLFNRTLYYGTFEDGDALNKILDIKCDDLKTVIEDISRKNSGVKVLLLKIFNYPKYLIFKRISGRKKRRDAKNK